MARFPRTVLLLAAASFLADVSGEMLMAVLPFLLVAQGATGVGLGLVGGMADAVGHLLKPVGGYVGDRTRRRMPLVMGGYLLAALSRIGIALASFWMFSLLFRMADRVGKGLRTAPREAVLAESVAPERRGRAFGFHRAADTAGAFVGVGLALVGFGVLGASASQIVLVGALLGLTTLVPLAFVHDAPARGEAAPKALLEPASPRYRQFLLVAAVFALGQVSYLFFLLRVAPALGGETGAVLLYLLFNAVYALGSYPMGRRADAVGKPRVLAFGFACFAASALLFALPPSLPLAVVGFVVLGVSFAAVDGTERAYAAELAGSAARGTRLGVFHGAVGLATFFGGLVAGFLWDRVGEWAAFAWGATLPLVALALLWAQGLLAGGRP